MLRINGFYIILHLYFYSKATRLVEEWTKNISVSYLETAARFWSNIANEIKVHVRTIWLRQFAGQKSTWNFCKKKECKLIASNTEDDNFKFLWTINS